MMMIIATATKMMTRRRRMRRIMMMMVVSIIIVCYDIIKGHIAQQLTDTMAPFYAELKSMRLEIGGDAESDTSSGNGFFFLSFSFFYEI